MKFLLESEGTLKYTKSLDYRDGTYSIVGHNVLVYDYIINDNKSICLIYLQKDGSLIYKLIHKEKTNESKISNFDIHSNVYNKISVLNINDKLNLIYSFYNIINPNVHTIHHIILNNNTENKYNVIKYVSKNIANSFVVDTDSNSNIHLFYNTLSQNFSYIYYTYFNPYKNQWLTNPMRLSSSDSHCESPAIYVDHMDNIHGLWWEKIQNDYKLKYKRMSTSGTEMYKWKEIDIPSIIQEKTFAKFYEINNNIYIDCLNYVLISDDFGLSWIKDENGVDMNERVGDDHITTLDDYNPNEEDYESHTNNDTLIDESDQIKYESILLNQEEILSNLIEIRDKQIKLESKLLDIDKALKEQSKGILRKFFLY